VQTNSGGCSSPPTVGSFRRNPASAQGVGGSVPVRKLISVASPFDKPHLQHECVHSDACESGLMGSTAGGGSGWSTEGFGFVKRNQEWWGFPTGAFTVCSISKTEVILAMLWLSLVGKKS